MPDQRRRLVLSVTVREESATGEAQYLCQHQEVYSEWPGGFDVDDQRLRESLTRNAYAAFEQARNAVLADL